MSHTRVKNCHQLSVFKSDSREKMVLLARQMVEFNGLLDTAELSTQHAKN